MQFFFFFKQKTAYEIGTGGVQTCALPICRSVNPSMERHWGWMSAVGAAVALADLDGDGLANDVCHVDTRTDRVTLAPAPSTGARYPLFALEPTGVSFDERTTDRTSVV